MFSLKKEGALFRKRLPIHGIWHYAVIIIISTILVTTSLSYTIYTSHIRNIDRELSLKASHIEKIFSELLEETSHILSYAGRQIIRSNKFNDLNYIARFLDQVWEADFKAKSCITFIEWVDDHNMQLANSQIGIIPDPVDMSFRPHTKECRKKPWQLQISPPCVGIPSGLWVIPAGIGVVDTEKNKFLGMLVVGISVAAITTKIVELTQANQTSFIVLDYSGNTILQTADNVTSLKNPFHQKALQELLAISKEGFLRDSLSSNQIDYRYCIKMDKLPYIILVGRHNTVFKKDFYALVLPRILEFGGMAIFCLLLLYLFKKHLIHFSKLSYKARENFLQTSNEDFFILSEIILRRLRAILKPSLNDPHRLIIIERIYNDIIQLKQLSTSEINIISIDVNKTLEESVLVISQLIFLQNKKITYEFQADIPKFNTDELRFKQIILSLLSIAMEGTKDGCEILIRTYVENTEHNNKQLIIHIMDNGFGLSSFEIKRLRDSHHFPPSQHFNGTELDIQEIIRLVELLGGNFQELSAVNKGLDIRLTLPYDDINKINREPSSKSNIYSFTRKKWKRKGSSYE